MSDEGWKVATELKWTHWTSASQLPGELSPPLSSAPHTRHSGARRDVKWGRSSQNPCAPARCAQVGEIVNKSKPAGPRQLQEVGGVSIE